MKKTLPPMPVYSRAEETVNTLTHGLGILLGGAVLVLCLKKASGEIDAVGAAVYGLCMILTYAASAIYHGLPAGRAKQVMRLVDHCAIYLLIAGTYTPILISGFGPVYPGICLGLLALQWGLTALAILLLAVDMRKYNVLSVVCYIGLGWVIFLFVKQAVEVLTLWGFWWVLAGGIAYTVGAALYGIGSRRKWFHSVFHIFVVLGSALQAVAIYYYVL